MIFVKNHIKPASLEACDYDVITSHNLNEKYNSEPGIPKNLEQTASKMVNIYLLLIQDLNLFGFHSSRYFIFENNIINNDFILPILAHLSVLEASIFKSSSVSS